MRTLKFNSNDSDLFFFCLKNWIIIFLTLGFYTPWAASNTRKYLIEHTTFEGLPFIYKGTGGELAKGFALASLSFSLLCISIGLIKVYFSGLLYYFTLSATALLFPVFIAYAIWSRQRYILSRTTYRGINFQLASSSRDPFITHFVFGLILLVLSFGLAFPYFRFKNYKLLLESTYYGNRRFETHKTTGQYVLEYYKCIFLIILTLGIYTPWAIAKMYNFKHSDIRLGNELYITTRMTGKNIFTLGLLRFLSACSASLTFPFEIAFFHRKKAETCLVEGTIEFDNIHSIYKHTPGALGDACGGLSLFDLGGL